MVEEEGNTKVEEASGDVIMGDIDECFAMLYTQTMM